MRVITVTLLLLFCLVAVAFALLNAQTVTIDYLISKSEMPLSLLILLTVLLGFVVGALFTLKFVFRSQRKAHALGKKVAVLQKEIDNLRAMPVKDVR